MEWYFLEGQGPEQSNEITSNSLAFNDSICGIPRTQSLLNYK